MEFVCSMGLDSIWSIPILAVYASYRLLGIGLVQKRGNSVRVILSYTLDLQQGKVISSAESPGGVGSLAWLHLG